MKYPYKIIVFIVLGCMLFMLFNIRNKNNAVNKNKNTDPLMEIPRSSNGELFTNKTGAKIVNESKWEISNIVKNISTTLPNKYLVRVYQKDKPVDEMDFIQRQSKVVMNSTIELPPQKRCAVIGNSGILLNSGCGDEINSHNFVIRCNIPAISEFTRDVGYKTNMMIVYQKTALELYNFSTNGWMPEDFRRRCQDLNDSIIWYPGVFSSRIRNVWKTNLNYLRSTLHIPAIFAYTTDTDLTSTVKRVLNLNKSPTSGMKTVVAALTLCDEVSVYGFFPFAEDTFGNRITYHYFGEYTKITMGFKTGHDFNDEFNLLSRLHDKNIVNFVYDKCK